MNTILRYRSLEIDNNGAERRIKPFVIGRKTGCFPILQKKLKQVL